MLLLQVIGYLSGVIFLILEGIENLLLSFNYYSGLFIAIITTIGWFLCNEYDKKKDYYHYKNQLSMDSQELKEKINLYLEGLNEFE